MEKVLAGGCAAVLARNAPGRKLTGLGASAFTCRARMTPALGPFEITIAFPDGRRERIPQPLVRRAFSSLPDAPADLKAGLERWTTAETRIYREDLVTMEQSLLQLVHTEPDELGLLNHFSGNGQLVNLDAESDDARGMSALYVLALALHRFRLLHDVLGSVIETVHIDAKGGGS